MKKGSILIGFVICFVIQATSQTWDSLPGSKINQNQIRVLYTDTFDNYMYLGGMFNAINGLHMKGIARWNGFQWDSLGAGIDGMNNNAQDNVYCINRYNNEIYAGGAFLSLGDKKAIAIGRWNGIVWDSLTVQPFHNSNSAVFTIYVLNNDLYIGGVFDTVAGIPAQGIAKWNGSNWTSLNFNLQNYVSVSAIAYYKNEIYAAGNFFDQISNDGTRNIMKYDGISWTKVGGGVNGWGIESMVVYNNELYVAGLFLSANGNAGNYIQKWNGTAWSDVGGGMGGLNNDPFDNAQIHKLIVYKNKLYAFGTQRYAGGVPAQCVSVWDGTNWCGLGSAFDNRLMTGCFYKDTLYIGGGFWTIDGDSINYIAKWNGGNYTDTCGNLTGIENTHNKSALNIYPNPNNGEMVLEYALEKDGYFILYDFTGRLVANYAISSKANSKRVNENSLCSGIYYGIIKTSDGTIVYSNKVLINK